MTIRAAQHNRGGALTFYVSASRPGQEHVVRYIRRAGQRRFYCSCPDFLFRRVDRKRHCKHCRAVAQLAKAAHGISKLPAAIAAFTENLPKTISLTEMAQPERGAA